jgi:serine protease Do
VSDDLRSQLPLPDSAGLIVRDVSEGSPAARAGLKVNDVLVRLDDQLLVNPPQMQSLVRGRKAGEEISLTVLRKGQETKLRAKLAQKIPDAAQPDSQDIVNLGTFDLDLNKLFGQLGTKGGPLVLQKTFSSSGTNVLDDAGLQSTVNEAVKKAMEQMQQQMNAQMPKHK